MEARIIWQFFAEWTLKTLANFKLHCKNAVCVLQVFYFAYLYKHISVYELTFVIFD